MSVCRCHGREPAGNDLALRQEESGCDQIVIRPRGLGPVKGFFLGSVASKVMKFSTLPVLLVK